MPDPSPSAAAAASAVARSEPGAWGFAHGLWPAPAWAFYAMAVVAALGTIAYAAVLGVTAARRRAP